MEAWMGLVGTIVGAFITGLGVFIRDKYQKEYQKEKDRRQLLMAKYEEIYQELSEFSAFAGQASMQMLSEVGYGGKFDAKKIGTSLAANKLKMNVLFYAPELAAAVSAIDSKVVTISRSITEFILKVDASKEEKGKLTGDAAVAAAEMSVLVTDAQGKLADLAKKQVNA